MLLFFCNVGRLHDSAKMYGEVFVNGQKSRLPYGSYVSNELCCVH